MTIITLIGLEEIFTLSYLMKQVFKMIFFFIVPIIFIVYVRKESVTKELHLKKPKKKELFTSLLFGLVLYVGTVGGYALLQFMFDAKQVIDGLLVQGITFNNFIFVGLYLSFINSFLEEFFFRGYLYYNMQKKSETLAVLGSSVLFSLYHVISMVLFFPWYTVIFVMIGLSIVGMFLAYMNRFGTSFINSYIMHVFADLAIISIGFYMFLFC
jgi:membrane protease YdiL (CAAX protease family)